MVHLGVPTLTNWLEKWWYEIQCWKWRFTFDNKLHGEPHMCPKHTNIVKRQQLKSETDHSTRDSCQTALLFIFPWRARSPRTTASSLHGGPGTQSHAQGPIRSPAYLHWVDKSSSSNLRQLLLSRRTPKRSSIILQPCVPRGSVRAPRRLRALAEAAPSRWEKCAWMEASAEGELDAAAGNGAVSPTQELLLMVNDTSLMPRIIKTSAFVCRVVFVLNV